MTHRSFVLRTLTLLGLVLSVLLFTMATLTLVQAQGSIAVTKTADPTEVPEPGGIVTFTVSVDNTSAETATLNSLVDDIHGDLNGVGDCTVTQTIAAGEFYQCTFTATVSGNAGDSETNVVTALGTDDDGNPVRADDSATVTITDVPSSITVIKTADPTSLPEPGGTVTFTVRVDNISAVDSVTITNLSDSIHGNLNGQGDCSAPQTIVAGEYYECSFSATASGNVGDIETDTVTASGSDDDGIPVSNDDAASVTITDVAPSIVVTKTADPAVVRVGDSVEFTIQVYNYSVEMVTLTSLDDTFFGDLTSECGLPADIAVGDFFECIVNRVISADHTNAVTATAEDDEGNTVTDSAEASVDVIYPTIRVVKEASVTRVKVGETIAYTYTVENIGDATLTNISLSDDRLGAIALTPVRVTNGLQALYTFEEGSGTTVHDVSGVGAPLHLTVEDEAAVNWLPGGGLSINSSTIAASAGAATKIIDAGKATNEISIEAWVRPANTTQGGPARIVTLSDGASLRNFTLAQQGSAYVTRLRTTATSDNGIPSLTAGTVTTSELSHVVYTRNASGVARFYVNSVEVGSRSDITGDFSNWDEGFRFGLANEFGADRTWLGEVHLVAIYNRALSQGEVSNNFEAGTGREGLSLFPGESITATATYTVDVGDTSPIVNVATATGNPPIGDPVSDTDTATVTVINPDIAIEKAVSPTTIYAGDTATYTYTVTNPGDDPLTDVVVTDDECSSVSSPTEIGGNGDDVLGPGEVWEYTCTTTLDEDTTNTATATGTDSTGGTVSDTDTAFVDVLNPGIEIAKTPDTQTVAGGTAATFTIAVTNTGDVALSDVTVSDALAPNCAWVIGDLDPEESANYECTRADVTDDFTNSATVTGTPPVGDVVTDTDTAEVKLDETLVCPANMSAYWKLDESNGPPYDDFYDGHDGTCGQQCPTPATGHLNGGQAFNGNNTEINVPADEDFDWGPTDSFSIEFWMKTDSVSTCAGNEVVIGRDDSSTYLHWWVGCRDGGQVAFYLRDNSGTLIWAIGTTDLTDGSWHHVMAIRDAEANEIRIYVDGVEEGSTPATYTYGFDSPTAGLNIGWLNLWHGYHFEGILDEVALYDRALSADEIRQHYNEGLAGRWYCEAGTFSPIIVSTPVTEATVGRPYTYDVEAAGNPAPTYILATSPNGMTIDPATGLISWAPTLAQIGNHHVEVEASNSEGTDTQSFTIVVTHVIAYWKLDESSGPPYDDFYDGHDGTCGQQCPTPATGHLNGGQAFNGSNSEINVPADEDFDWGPTDSFSIEFWMKTDSVSTCAGNEVVIGRDDSSTYLHWWVGCRDGGQAAFYLRDTSGTLVWAIGTTDLTDGSWHHVMAVRDAEANEIRIYVDGVEEGSTPATYTYGFDSPTAGLNIGWLNLFHGYHFEGILDEVALYNTALYGRAPFPGEFELFLPVIFKN